MVKVIVGGIISCVGIAFAILVWAIIYPAISSAIPAGEWHQLISIGVGIVIACLGGIGLPLVISIAGIMFMFS